MNDKTKLPKWAQQAITDLERRTDSAESALKKYLDSKNPSRIWTERGLSERNYVQDNRVVFQLEHGTISMWLDKETIECHATYGFGRLVVVPHVTNVVHLEIEESR